MDKCTEVNRLYIKAHRLKLEGAERLDRYALRDLARISKGSPISAIRAWGSVGRADCGFSGTGQTRSSPCRR